VRKPPLPVFVALGLGFHGLVYSLLPRLAARHDRKLGWRGGRPGPVNRVGQAGIGAGALFIAGAVVGHHRAAPDDHAVVRPVYLATGGSYARSRNPLYVGGMTIWFGWALFLGSRRAVAVGLAWLAGLALVGVPYEERKLTAQFGDSYTR